MVERDRIRTVVELYSEIGVVLERDHGCEGGKVYTYQASNKNTLKKDAEGLLIKENF